MLIPAIAWISALLGASALTWWSYRFLWPKSHWWKMAATLRWVVVFTAILWLFNPKILVNHHELIPARYDVYVDVSASNKPQLKEINAFLDSWQSQLEGVELRRFAFAEQVRPMQELELLGGNQTRLDRVYEHMIIHQNRTNLRAIISDGIENQGRLIESYTPESVGAVAVLATGDTTSYPDIVLRELLVNKEVFQGNSTEAEAVVEANNVKGQSLKLVWKLNDQIVQTQIWIPNSTKEQKRFAYRLQTQSKQSDWIGLQAELVPLNVERNTRNNVKAATIRIRDNKKSIQIFYGAPHPDIKAIRLALKQKDAYEIRLSEQSEPISESADLIIAHGITNGSLLAALKRIKVPIWWFANDAFMLNYILANEETAAFRKGLKGTQEVLPAINQDFGLFEMAEPIQVNNSWKSLSAPYVALNRATEQVQIWQIWGGKKTNIPLMFTEKQGDRHQHVFLGSGIWQWRMNEMRMQKNADVFDAWVGRNIQYLARVAEGKKGWDFLGVPSQVSKGDRLKLKWQYLDAAGELAVKTGMSAFVKVKGNIQRIPLHVENKTYISNWTASESGPVQVWLQEANGEKVGEGSFMVRAFSQELEELKAKHAGLAKFAKNSGGFFGDFRNRDNWKLEIQKLGLQKGTLKTTKQWQGLEQWWWIMSVLIGFISIEWFLRKWMGNI